MKILMNLIKAIIASLVIALPNLAWAVYPEKPIELIVPYGPGGGTDLSARVLAPAIEKILGQPVVVVNKPGGGGAKALTQIYSSKPDGYTIALGTGSNMTIIPHATEVAYKVENFSYIANYFGWPYIIVKHPSVPGNSLKEVLDWAKKNPDGLVSATTGGFNLHVVAMGLISERAGGIKYRELPTNSASQSTARVLAGDANIVVGSPATYMKHIKAGKLQAVAIISDVVGPALEGQGLEKAIGALGFELTNTTVVIAPPGVPEDIRKKIQDAVETALKDPDVIKKLSDLGFPVLYESGPDAKKKTMATYDSYGKVIKKLLANR